MTDAPHDNLHAIDYDIVSSKGLKQNGEETTGIHPEAVVEATVRAGEVPKASVVVIHNRPNDMRLGPVHDYAEWRGTAGATLTRSYWYASENRVEHQPDKHLSQELYLSVVRKESEWKAVVTGMLAGAALSELLEVHWQRTKAPIPYGGRVAIYVSIIIAGGSFGPKLFGKEIYNEVDMKSSLVLEHDPIPGYWSRGKCRMIRRAQFYPHQIIDSSADVSGTWTHSDPDTFGITMNGDAPVYRHSHSHVEGNGYGPLHTGMEEQDRGFPITPEIIPHLPFK